nr:fibrous sheath CABYR-binding protein [Helicoverpa armigera]XP_049695854.1 fibrous sheath CABYR-binding protein [Helicoverpa armigera]
MKIPETTANVGAYYGNEENGQWQPNGVIIDSGVGGGVVGSGDAGIHRPPVYPVHIPRAHMPGYVMAGAYYPPAAYPPVPAQPQPDDFADYMWMENEEEFDKQVMQQLEEEALMEQCIEAMLEDEQRERHNRPHNAHNHHYPTTSNGASSLSLEETVSRSTLNPLAAEFVPTRPLAGATEERQESAPAPVTQPSAEDTTTHTPTHTEQDKTEDSVQPQKDPPEVSAADIDKRPKDKPSKAKIDTKKPLKTEVKSKAKPQTVKSETKVTPKKKEVKTVKSETKIEEKSEESDVKPSPAPLEDTQSTGFKPINYAAAAKANKPKKPTATIDKPAAQPKADKPKPIDKTEKKDKTKTEKVNVQRKNSAK